MAESENNTFEEEEEEPCVTMIDILEREKRMEAEYAAVLGASDDRYCTYQEGSLKRQAIYSCLTCCPEAREDLEKCAGICLACSYQCHENHELVELYTKRNFRCDCPTERMPQGMCMLNAEILVDGKQMPNNSGNNYNQNFQGLYCVCKRPYPDTENPSEEMMLQCAVCEDWYHLNHLDVEVNKLREDYYEMVCGGCMEKYDFLKDYAGFALKMLEETSESANVSVVETDAKLMSDLDQSIAEGTSESANVAVVETDDKLKSDLDKSIAEGTSESANVAVVETDDKLKSDLDKSIAEGTSESANVAVVETDDKLKSDLDKSIAEGTSESANVAVVETDDKLKSDLDKSIAEGTSESANVSVVETDDKLKSDLDKSIAEIMNIGGEDGNASTSEPNTSAKASEGEKTQDNEGENVSDEPAAKIPKIAPGAQCKRPQIKNDWEKGATFWPTGWRSALCDCNKCCAIYIEAKVPYLLDPEDSATYYEENGRRRVTETTYEQGIRAFSTIGHTQQIDAITKYTRMKEKLKEYLQPFVINRQVVTEEDINRFFQQMRNENIDIGLPYFCR